MNSQVITHILKDLEFLAKNSSKRDVSMFLIKFMNELIAVSKSDGGTLYLLVKKNLVSEYVFNSTLNMQLFDHNIKIPITLKRGMEGKQGMHICVQSLLENKVIDIEDIYEQSEYVNEGVKSFDASQNYRTRSMLTVPLYDGANPLGVIQLVNSKTDSGEIVSFGKDLVKEVTVLSMVVSLFLGLIKSGTKKNVKFIIISIVSVVLLFLCLI